MDLLLDQHCSVPVKPIQCPIANGIGYQAHSMVAPFWWKSHIDQVVQAAAVSIIMHGRMVSHHGSGGYFCAP